MSEVGKNFKIWGMSYGLIGDLIMGLPMLTYFEKKYPGSYKYWVIEKKCADCAPIYFNHSLIDCIKITDEWSGFGDNDNRIMSSCNALTTSVGWRHSRGDWYNYTNCVEETAYVAGVEDLSSVLTSEEMVPKLNMWFDVGFRDKTFNTYAKESKLDNFDFSNNIAIWPTATAGKDSGRSPSVEWWTEYIKEVTDNGFTVFQYGHESSIDLCINNMCKNITHLSFFEQIKASLASSFCVGTDSGIMWVMGAYQHKAIHLMTNWMLGHKYNLLALEPINSNSVCLFAENGCDNIDIKEAIKCSMNYKK